MEKNPQPNALALTLSDGVIPSDNVGSGLKEFSGHGGFRSGSGENGEQRGSVANTEQTSRRGLFAKFSEATSKAISKAKEQSTETGKPWQLMADQYTKNVLADCPKREVSKQTQGKYEKEFSRLWASGTTAYEKASTAQHWNLLRTASRFCMETEIKRLRANSEKARLEKNITTAQKLTEQAFRLAVMLNEQFLSHGHKTWADKKAEMDRAGIKPVSKSKRNSKTPNINFTCVALIDKSKHRGWKLAERHAERLAVIALTGCRPAELMKGIEVTVSPRGLLAFQILGAKTGQQRGQEKRFIGFPPSCALSRGLVQSCKEAGGRIRVTMTQADYRSLNRALKPHGLSCYSFRHAFGTELKNALAEKKLTPVQVAQAMGHASAKSVTYYGRTTRRRRGRARTIEVRAGAVKVCAVTKAQKQQKRMKDFRFPPRPASEKSLSYASGPKWKIPKGPKPPSVSG